MVAENTTESLQTTAESPQKPRKRKIREQDIEQIAELVADGLTETHAANSIGIPTKQWFHFKHGGKRTARIGELFARMIGSRQKSWVGEIKKAATGTSGVRHDWRAAQFLGSLHDPRFSSRPETNITVNNQTAVTSGLGGLDALARLVNGLSSKRLAKAATQAAIDCPPAKVNDDKAA